MTLARCDSEQLSRVLRGMESVSVGCLPVTRLPVKAALLGCPDPEGRPFTVYGQPVRVAEASPVAADDAAVAGL